MGQPQVGPDTICYPPFQANYPILVVATDAQARRIKWACSGGGGMGRLPYAGTITGPTLLLSALAPPNHGLQYPGRFGTGASVQRSQQTNTLLAGLRLPQGQRPMSAKQIEQVLSAPFPNPAPAGASVRWPGMATPAALLNLQGQCLGTMTPDGQGLYRLPPGLAPGLYLLRRGSQTARLAVGS